MKQKSILGKSLFFVAGCILSIVSVVRAEDQIFISQVQIAGTKTTDDFVELHNPNVNPFNLKGYRLVKRTANASTDTLIKSWTDDTLVPAQGFYLWANSNFVGIASTPNATTTGTLAADNGIAIRLGVNDTGTIVDSAAWGTVNNSFAVVSSSSPLADQSLKRESFQISSRFIIGQSAPRSSELVIATTTPDVVSTSTPTSTPASETSTTTPIVDASSTSGGGNPVVSVNKPTTIAITEVCPNPAGDDSGNEWFVLQTTMGLN